MDNNNKPIGGSMLGQIASALGRNDEIPNTELAEKIIQSNSKAGIDEMVAGLGMEGRIANDCIKVLYEVGERKPELIAPHTNVFLSLLHSKNNRLVWGAMTALAQVTALAPAQVFARIDDIYSAYENGSVITVDHSISVFAALCKADAKYERKILPILIHHLANCRAKEIPQHMERMSICFSKDNIGQFQKVLRVRYDELSISQQARVKRLLKKHAFSE